MRASDFHGPSKAPQPTPMGCLFTHEVSVGHAVGRMSYRDGWGGSLTAARRFSRGGNGWRVLLDGVMCGSLVGFTIRFQPIQRPS